MQQQRIVLELAEPAVAVEAQYPAHPTVAVIVVDVFRVGRATDRADPVLLREELPKLPLPDPIPPPQVVINRRVPSPLSFRRGMSVLLLFSPFLYITPHELFCVFFEDRVDFVEQVVDILGDLGVPLGDLRVSLRRRAGVDLLVAARLAGLRLTAGVPGSHPCPSSSSVVRNLPRRYDESPATQQLSDNGRP
jgi:hypothetical protein